MLKDIVVNLSVGRTDNVACDYAVSLAEMFEAHVAGVAFAYEPVIPAVMGGIPADLIDAQWRENQQAAKAALTHFDAAAKRAGVSADTRTLEASMPGAASAFGQIARRFDLSVVAQSEPERTLPEELIIEAALFDAGRPVLVVPYIQKQGAKLERVVVCWDGSRNAARAIADAMPLLHRAKAVDVLIVASEAGKSTDVPGADIGQHLARHGLKVDVKRITADIEVADAILSHAADSGADLLVMGGYGHSRLREFILGGVTRNILQSMTVPVLMSH